MKILYSTDLHGNHRKYKDLLGIAQRQQVNALILGGDNTPKNSKLSEWPALQAEWLSVWFRKHLAQYKTAGISVFTIMGNDDAAVNLGILEELEREGLLKLLDGRLQKLDDYELIGFPYVPCTPYPVKDWELLDFEGWLAPKLFSSSSSVCSGDKGGQKGWYAIDDYREFFRIKPTIQRALEGLPEPSDFSKTIYVIHSPPVGMDLDICANGYRAGSLSVLRYLKKRLPLISLHGHIHESPKYANGKYWDKKHGWLAVQPGQIGKNVQAVIFDPNQAQQTLTHTAYK